MTTPGVTSAIVQRVLPAPPEEVYDAWLGPTSLLEWMCPRPARCLKVAERALLEQRLS